MCFDCVWVCQFLCSLTWVCCLVVFSLCGCWWLLVLEDVCCWYFYFYVVVNGGLIADELGFLCCVCFWVCYVLLIYRCWLVTELLLLGVLLWAIGCCYLSVVLWCWLCLLRCVIWHISCEFGWFALGCFVFLLEFTFNCYWCWCWLYFVLGFWLFVLCKL